MSLQNQLNLQQDFEAAVTRVNGLPGDQAAAHMNELYGLYKQATEGDHDTKSNEVGDDSPDMPSGYKGMSQAQWDSWSKFKGVSQDDAKRQYIEKVKEIAGPIGEDTSIITGNGQPTTPSQVTPDSSTGETLPPGTAKAPFENQGGVSAGGLRGDINAGAPYGGEDGLKLEQ
jgi:acyl-CoA-binding protein